MTHKKEHAFTLAEVLITLGIIGIVAALTMPMLLSNYRKQVVETRLAKFYSAMNQAIQQSEVDNGPKEYWPAQGNGFLTDEEGNIDKTQSANMAWYKKYLAPYLKVTDVRVNDVEGNVMVYFPDGSLVLIEGNAWHFWPEAKNFQQYSINETTGESKNNYKPSGIKYFTFMFWPSWKENKYSYKHGMEAYATSGWDGRRESLFADNSIGCKETVSNERAYCARLIQMNGWKIPKDYPLKF